MTLYLKKIFLLLIIVVISASCNKVVLKKYTVEKAPFKNEEGAYTINLYKIEYPENIKEKEGFFNRMDVFVNKVFIQEKKYTLLVEEKYLKDYDLIKNTGLLEEESIFVKTASSLTEEEKKKIEAITGIDVKRHENTVQKYLNMQIYHFKNILEYDNFDANKVYTELYKENIINEVKKKRKNTILINEKLKINYIVDIKEPYTKQDKLIEEEAIYYYTKNIEYDKKRIFSENINSYSIPVFLRDIKKQDINILVDKEENLKSSCILVWNDYFKGYRYNKSTFYFFLGGKEEIYEFENYKININLEVKDYEEILEFDEEYRLSDFIGGK